MSRLPIPGGDNGNWGAVLNDFLLVEHAADGTLKLGSVIASKYTKPATGIPESDLSASVQGKLNSGGGGGYIKPVTGIPLTDLSTAVQNTLAASANHFTAVPGAKVLVSQDFTNASTARCTSRTDVTVRWRGPVEPLNMLLGDEWYVTPS